MKKLHVTTREKWRAWLEKNHASEEDVWLIYNKKHTGKPRVEYGDAVEEALCFGWIDSTIKTIDDDRYMQRFTPRKAKSSWSESNKKRVKKPIKSGEMTGAGLKLVDAAKANGCWDEVPAGARSCEMPGELADALAKHEKANDFFESLTPAQKKHYIGWIASAKRQETRNRRAAEAVNLLSSGKKLGMK